MKHKFKPGDWVEFDMDASINKGLNFSGYDKIFQVKKVYKDDQNEYYIETTSDNTFYIERFKYYKKHYFEEQLKELLSDDIGRKSD